MSFVAAGFSLRSRRNLKVAATGSYVLLSPRKHNEKVNIVAVLNGFSEFIWVGSRMIYKNLNDVAQLVLFGKQRFLHSRELGDEVVEAFPHCISLYGDHILPVRKLSVGDVNMYLNRHILLPRLTMPFAVIVSA
jgi:hypothetical protein